MQGYRITCQINILKLMQLFKLCINKIVAIKKKKIVMR